MIFAPLVTLHRLTLSSLAISLCVLPVFSIFRIRHLFERVSTSEAVKISRRKLYISFFDFICFMLTDISLIFSNVHAPCVSIYSNIIKYNFVSVNSNKKYFPFHSEVLPHGNYYHYVIFGFHFIPRRSEEVRCV